MIKKEFTAVGCFFISISAFLYASKHITAAIMTSYMNNTKASYFDGGYDSMGTGITVWIFFAFILGMFLIITGFWPVLQKMFKSKK